MEKTLNFYLNALKKNCAEFSQVDKQHQANLKKMKKLFPYTDKLTQLYEQMGLSNILFAYECGIKDNLAHFKNPNDITFLDKSFNESARDDEMLSRESYVSAQNEIEALLEIMPFEAEEIYCDMLEYFTFLDTYIPKMAHYYGFMSANKELAKTVDGYKEDPQLNADYKEWLSVYLGIDL